MSDWKTIESAPKNGISILVTVAGYDPVVSCWAYDRWVPTHHLDNEDNTWACEIDEECEMSAPPSMPTHWMNLPETPK